MRKTQLVILLLVLVLAACGQASPGALAPTAGQPTTPALSTQEPTVPPEPTAPATAPTGPAMSAPTAPATGDAPSDQLVQQARAQLAQHLGVNEKSLTLHDASAQEWPNSALGCPSADAAYSEIISPGFLLNFAANGHTYPVHTDQQGTQLVLCENAQPTDISSGASTDDQAATPISGDGATSVPDQAPTLQPDAASVPIVVTAREKLATELGIAADAVTVVGVEAVEWSDSSLGCPKPDMNYLQVITPGYKITFEAQGTRYEYHTDQRTTVVRCTPA